MSINIDHGYKQGLMAAKPTFFGSQTVKPPPGAQGEERIQPAIIIPPLNTDIDFSMLPTFTIDSHKGLADLAEQPLEITFNWRDGSYNENKGQFELSPQLRKKIPNISSPANQMLCGSCWAMAGSGIVGDSFVISDVVDWKPNLSATYCLACYPQKQCHGGNPAKLLIDISRGGIVSKHCIDYSWCETNQWCNGDALKHFKMQHQHQRHILNNLIPPCGCLEKGDFYKFMVDSEPGPQQLSIGMHNMDPQKLKATIKAHIRHKGPVLGSFLVFENFMKGYFTKSKPNKGLYLENAVYQANGTVTYQTIDTKSYKGSHAVAIIGWGIEKNVQLDNNGKKQDVPYWFVRNSWTSKWGDKGYFKMAMYPFNKLSQFDKLVRINTPMGPVEAGGMVVFNTTKAPKKVSFKQVAKDFSTKKRIKPNEYYKKDKKDRPKLISRNSTRHFSLPKLTIRMGGVLKIMGILLLLAFIFTMGYLDGRGYEKEIQRILISSIFILTMIATALAIRIVVKNYCKLEN